MFGPEPVNWRVHTEPILLVGSVRALLLRSLHPRVMRGTAQNSEPLDPAKTWQRFERTVEFVSTRTFRSTAEDERAGRRVRQLHARLRGSSDVYLVKFVAIPFQLATRPDRLHADHEGLGGMGGRSSIWCEECA